MGLDITQTFTSSFSIEQLINGLKDSSFHKVRAQSKNLKHLDIDSALTDQLSISRQLDFDIPLPAQKFVSNPIELSEIWNFTTNNIIYIEVVISNISTKIKTKMGFKQILEGCEIEVISSIESNIFLMSSFAEEFISKYWKEAIAKDFDTLNIWLKS